MKSSSVPHTGAPRPRFILSLAAWTLALPLAGPGPVRALGAVPLFPDEVVAKGKGLEIRRSQLDDAITALRVAFTLQGQRPPEDRPGELEAKVLDRLVLNNILLQKATDADRAKGKESAAKLVDDTRKRAASEEAYRRQLLVAGLKPEQYENRLQEQAICEQVVERELRSKIVVGTEQAREFYEDGVDPEAQELKGVVERLAQTGPQTVFYKDGKKKLDDLKAANLARLNRPETVRACHILLYTLDKVTRDGLSDEAKKAKRASIQKLLERARGGEDFVKLAREFSEDPEVQQTGGEYTVSRDANMAPELKEALFALKPGELSEVIVTAYGFHVAKVLERTPAGKPPFEKIEKELKEYLTNLELQRRIPAYLEGLKKEFQVESTLKPPAP